MTNKAVSSQLPEQETGHWNTVAHTTSPGHVMSTSVSTARPGAVQEVGSSGWLLRPSSAVPYGVEESGGDNATTDYVGLAISPATLNGATGPAAVQEVGRNVGVLCPSAVCADVPYGQQETFHFSFVTSV